MTILQSIILGIVQGLTEFLPISSSAHLVLIPHLLGWELNEEFVFPFNVLIQVGTLVAVIIYYRKDFAEIIKSVISGIRSRKPFEEEAARIGWLAVLATIPAGLIGLLVKDQVEAAFSSPQVTAVLLFVTAGLLILAEFVGRKTRELGELRWLDAFWIGSFQVLSVLPGISRSASTIAGGMTRQFTRKSAGQFSFLLAIPILAAAGLLGLTDLLALDNLSAVLPQMGIGFVISTVVGYFAIRWLITYISNNSLLPFAGYCMVLGAGSLLLLGFPQPPQISAVAEPPAKIAEINTYLVSIDPDLEWLLPSMNACREEADLDILFQQKATPEPSGLTDDVFVAFGEIDGLSDAVFQIGTDTLVLAAHPANSLDIVSINLTARIFSGDLKNWADAEAFCAECFASAPQPSEIVLFTYPSETKARDFTLALLPPGFNLASTALIAPGAKQVREAIALDPNAVGFLPRNWLNTSVKEVPWLDEPADSSSIPILVYTTNNYDENLAEWLVCVQNRTE